jgi:hypothetical protein
MAEGIVVVLVHVVGEDAVDADAAHVQEDVVDLVGIAAVVEGGGEGMGQTDVGIELAHREGSRIAGKSRSRRLDEDGQAKEIEAVSLDRLDTHSWPLRECEILVGSTSQTRPEAKPFWSRLISRVNGHSPVPGDRVSSVQAGGRDHKRVIA